ncbi:unnamed protein product, partial [marine sediment metagenome]
EPKEPTKEEREKVILDVLEGNVKEVVDAVNQAESAEVLSLTFDLESAGKNRTTVLKAILRRVSQIEETIEPEPEYVPPVVKVTVRGNIDEIRGSFWEDNEGNIYVLDAKMGEPTGVFAVRLFRRHGS